MFRAFYYVSYRRQQQMVEAKKVGFKLPFSFLRADWQRYQPDFLARVHNELYMIDGNLKRGGSVVQLERIFIPFF
jgi:hypothetical protein